MIIFNEKAHKYDWFLFDCFTLSYLFSLPTSMGDYIEKQLESRWNKVELSDPEIEEFTSRVGDIFTLESNDTSRYFVAVTDDGFPAIIAQNKLTGELRAYASNYIPKEEVLDEWSPTT